MQSELEEVVGPEAAERALDEDEREGPPQRQTLLAVAWSSRLLIGLLLVAALVVGAFLSVLTGSWWLMAAALAVHFVGTTVVLYTVFRLLGDVEAPSATASAALEARGIHDPEGELSRLVERAQGASANGSGEEATRQQASWTPGDRSRPVDRGDTR